MKTSTEIRSEIFRTEWARNLATMSGYHELARTAANELITLYGELDARAERNKGQTENYKKSIKGK